MQLVETFKDFYSNFNAQALGRLEEFYHRDAVFIDPIHEVKGAAAIRAYFEGVGRGLNYCRFEFQSTNVAETTAVLEWTMKYSHPKLKSGKELSLAGCSVVVFETIDGVLKVSSHRDYYDVGEMLYEQLPVIGRVICYLKNKLKSS